MPTETLFVQGSRERRALELQLQRQLKDARSRHRTGHLPKGCGVDVHVASASVRQNPHQENRMVQHIEGFRAEG